MPISAITQNRASPGSTASGFESGDVALEFDGDPGEEIAVLAIESARTDHHVETQIQKTQEDIAKAESNAEIAALEQKASNLRTCGLIDGCLGFAEAGFQADSAMSGFQGTGATGSMAAMSKVHGGLDDAAIQTLQAAGKVSDAMFSASEAGDDATSKADGVAADRATTAARDAHDAAKTQEDVLDKALDFYKTYTQTQASTTLTIAQRV